MNRLRGRVPFVAVLAAALVALCVGLVLVLPSAMPADVGWVAYSPLDSATSAGSLVVLSTRTVIGLVLIVVALVAGGGMSGFALGRRARLRPDRVAADSEGPPRP